MNNQPNDLHDYLTAMTQDMARDYHQIQKRAVEDPGTAGDQGEENWAELLRGWLPSTYHIETKGRVLGYDGKASPQVDVLVLRPSYPRKLLKNKLYLAGGVAAVFECKVTLKKEHLTQTFATSATLKNLFIPRTGTPYKELHAPIVYGILCHSHSWSKKKVLSNISEHIDNLNKTFAHPREMLDILCVADTGTWIAKKRINSLPDEEVEDDAPEWRKEAANVPHWKQGATHAGYIGYWPDTTNLPGVTSVGVMLTHLLDRLAWEDFSLRSIVDHFLLAGLMEGGAGRLRYWNPKEIYSEVVATRVQFGAWARHAPRTYAIGSAEWEEWADEF